MSKLREDWISEVKNNPLRFAHWSKSYGGYVVDKNKIITELECGLGTQVKLLLILEKVVKALPPPGTETVNPVSVQ